jgi:hypothetical protein
MTTYTTPLAALIATIHTATVTPAGVGRDGLVAEFAALTAALDAAQQLTAALAERRRNVVANAAGIGTLTDFSRALNATGVEITYPRLQAMNPAPRPGKQLQLFKVTTPGGNSTRYVQAARASLVHGRFGTVRVEAVDAIPSDATIEILA